MQNCKNFSWSVALSRRAKQLQLPNWIELLQVSFSTSFLHKTSFDFFLSIENKNNLMQIFIKEKKNLLICTGTKSKFFRIKSLAHTPVGRFKIVLLTNEINKKQWRLLSDKPNQIQ